MRKVNIVTVLILVIFISIILSSCSIRTMSDNNDSIVKQDTKKSIVLDESKIADLNGEFQILGNVDGTIAINEKQCTLVGWTYCEDRKIESIVLVNKDISAVYNANYGISRPGLPEAINKSNDVLNSGWEAVVPFNGYYEISIYLLIEGQYYKWKEDIGIGDKSLGYLRENENNPDYNYNKKMDKYSIKESMCEYSIYGCFDIAEPTGNNIFHVYGWAYSEDKEIEYIVIANITGVMRGTAKVGIERPGLSEAIGKKDAFYSGFDGFARLQAEDEELIAYAKVKGENSYVQLNNSILCKVHYTKIVGL